jgi:hypothetical protein
MLALKKSLIQENNKHNPKKRRCDLCPRWKTMCKSIYDNSGILPEIEYCPIHNNTYNPNTGLWYYQTGDDIIKSDDGIESKIKAGIKDLNDSGDYLVNKINEDHYIIEYDLNEKSELFDKFYVHVEKRKIDVLIHDNQFLFNNLESLNALPYFTKSYQYMKKHFRKIQLRGSSNNKIYFELYDLVKFSEHIYSYLEIYTKMLSILDFELSGTRVFIDDIYGEMEIEDE